MMTSFLLLRLQGRRISVRVKVKWRHCALLLWPINFTASLFWTILREHWAIAHRYLEIHILKMHPVLKYHPMRQEMSPRTSDFSAFWKSMAMHETILGVDFNRLYCDDSCCTTFLGTIQTLFVWCFVWCMPSSNCFAQLANWRASF